MAKNALRPLAIIPLGDLAAYVEFSRTLDLEVNALVQRLAAAVHALNLPWIRDVVPALGGLALHFDPGYEGNGLEAAAEVIEHCLQAGLPRSDDVLRTVQGPVCYEDEFAPDMKELPSRTQLTASEIVALHSSA